MVKQRRINRRLRQRSSSRAKLIPTDNHENERQYWYTALDKTRKRVDKHIFLQFGFLANPAHTVAQNATKFLGDMNPWLYFSKPTNLACHDLRTGKYRQRSMYHSIISLGLNFIARQNTTTSPNDIDATRFQRDAYTKFLFCNEKQSQQPKLFYTKQFLPQQTRNR